MRLLALVLTLGFTASAVLELRSQRLEMLHAMAVLHLDMDRHRRAAWDLQHRVSLATSPAALAAAIAAADLPEPSSVDRDGDDASNGLRRATVDAESADRDAGAAQNATVRGFEAIPQMSAAGSNP